MEVYLKRHEAFVRGQLASAVGGADWAGLARFHRAQISYLQHERLVHLLWRCSCACSRASASTPSPINCWAASAGFLAYLALR